MEAPRSLRRPANWQDFETLCKKLWGEIWNCPEIKKNGRPGQQQHGVDIYGIPFGEEAYFGIQCKGKDEYTHKQFTEQEIISEIEKAKLFQPLLKKLYLATTAVKDGPVEQFVRTKNIEHRSAMLFEVHLFSWEDIVDLIDENKQTHDWYVKSQGFKLDKSASVTFQNGSNVLIISPKFKKTIIQYQKRPNVSPNHPAGLDTFFGRSDKFAQFPSIQIPSPFTSTKINMSYCKIEFRIKNTGNAPIEDYKMSFQFVGEIEDMKRENESGGILGYIRPAGWQTNLYFDKETSSGRIVPLKGILVGDDTFISDDLFIKPAPREYEIGVRWKLISRDFKDEGELTLNVQPNIEIITNVILTEEPDKIGTQKIHSFEDLIIDNN